MSARFKTELATLPDDEVETSLRRFAELGEAGLNALATSLTSDRAAVRNASHRVLLEEVDRWELLSESAIAPRLESLAKGLAENAPRMDAESRRFAADLALRLLLWPHEADGRPSPWLADCEAVLETTAENRHPNGNKSAHHPDGKARKRNGAIAAIRIADALGLGDDLGRQGSIAGRRFAVGNVADAGRRWFCRTAGRAEGAERRRPNRDVCKCPSAADRSTATTAILTPATMTTMRSRRRPIVPARLPSASGSSRPMELGLQARKQSLGGPPANDKAAWQQLQPRDVMQRLHVSDPQVVQAARVELERRGIKGSLVDLARRATDPDPKVRRELAESLPSIPGIDAKPWLMEFSYDENAQVRATAVTLMATSGDLELVRRLEQIARDDPDDYIRAQAAKALVPRLR